ncbi:uncharacterized protein MYCFIDRAFT_203720 [Pseudocercospora fijiensis CIRAD86]|uniref:Uncharacterized protein n=1 Tax=Pseudocercospora fijiensis (strain CIRAD86) TaxID=383855 RepID=M3B2Y4_PSEFD|nr:uncharacterized protein MYCFIDRAFT_203720 [Pseudocercospora fijiensis CIRAD86]EME83723.1 hypothetical protein MYCFIDRAFT_203720 [Pseudocercospora fijiensis CIRAD86]
MNDTGAGGSPPPSCGARAPPKRKACCCCCCWCGRLGGVVGGGIVKVSGARWTSHAASSFKQLGCRSCMRQELILDYWEWTEQSTCRNIWIPLTRHIATLSQKQ